jgi:hypothetical protein
VTKAGRAVTIGMMMIPGIGPPDITTPTVKERGSEKEPKTKRERRTEREQLLPPPQCRIHIPLSEKRVIESGYLKKRSG